MCWFLHWLTWFQGFENKILVAENWHFPIHSLGGEVGNVKYTKEKMT